MNCMNNTLDATAADEEAYVIKINKRMKCKGINNKEDVKKKIQKRLNEIKEGYCGNNKIASAVLEYIDNMGGIKNIEYDLFWRVDKIFFKQSSQMPRTYLFCVRYFGIKSEENRNFPLHSMYLEPLEPKKSKLCEKRKNQIKLIKSKDRKWIERYCWISVNNENICWLCHLTVNNIKIAKYLVSKFVRYFDFSDPDDSHAQVLKSFYESKLMLKEKVFHIHRKSAKPCEEEKIDLKDTSKEQK